MSSTTVRITVNHKLRELLDELKIQFPGLDDPELFKLSLSNLVTNSRKNATRFSKQINTQDSELNSNEMASLALKTFDRDEDDQPESWEDLYDKNKLKKINWNNL